MCGKADECPDPAKTAEDYAGSVCQKYRLKYPNLLSGVGRQVRLRTASQDTACIVACQDRGWKDIHYQMDSFEDGKFPMGTSCSRFGESAYCVNGKCVHFDESDTPVDQSRGVLEFALKFLTVKGHRYRRSATQSLDADMPVMSFGERLNHSNRYSDLWQPVLPPRPVRFEPPPGDPVNSSNTLRLQTYTWAISLSECSAKCGPGMQVATVTCRHGQQEVEDSLCDARTKPHESQVRSCNTHCIGS